MHSPLLAHESCYQILMKLPSLEDAFNSVLLAMEIVAAAHQINPEEIEGQTLLVIAGRS
jgi:hypothetical protein